MDFFLIKELMLKYSQYFFESKAVRFGLFGGAVKIYIF